MLSQLFSRQKEKAADDAGMKFRTRKNSKPIPVLIDESLRARIETVSERMGEPKSTVMRISMRIGLDQLEAAFAGKSAESILSSIQTEIRPAAPGGAPLPPAALNEPDDGGPSAAPPPIAPPSGPVQYPKPRRKRGK